MPDELYDIVVGAVVVLLLQRAAGGEIPRDPVSE